MSAPPAPRRGCAHRILPGAALTPRYPGPNLPSATHTCVPAPVSGPLQRVTGARRRPSSPHAGSRRNQPGHIHRGEPRAHPPSRPGCTAPREATPGRRPPARRPHVEGRQPSLGRAVQLADQLHGPLAEHGGRAGPYRPPALRQTAADQALRFQLLQVLDARGRPRLRAALAPKHATNRSALPASRLRRRPRDICLCCAAAVPQGAPHLGGCGSWCGFSPALLSRPRSELRLSRRTAPAQHSSGWTYVPFSVGFIHSRLG